MPLKERPAKILKKRGDYLMLWPELIWRTGPFPSYLPPFQVLSLPFILRLPISKTPISGDWFTFGPPIPPSGSCPFWPPFLRLAKTDNKHEKPCTGQFSKLCVSEQKKSIANQRIESRKYRNTQPPDFITPFGERYNLELICFYLKKTKTWPWSWPFTKQRAKL